MTSVNDLDDLTVYATEPWNAVSEAVVALDPVDGTLPPAATGMACEAVIHYATRDAYLMPDA